MVNKFPPEPESYHLILFPVEIAEILEVALAHTIEGLATGEVGADGSAVTFIVVVTELVHPVVTV